MTAAEELDRGPPPALTDLHRQIAVAIVSKRRRDDEMTKLRHHCEDLEKELQELRGVGGRAEQAPAPTWHWHVLEAAAQAGEAPTGADDATWDVPAAMATAQLWLHATSCLSGRCALFLAATQRYFAAKQASVDGASPGAPPPVAALLERSPMEALLEVLEDWLMAPGSGSVSSERERPEEEDMPRRASTRRRPRAPEVRDADNEAPVPLPSPPLSLTLAVDCIAGLLAARQTTWPSYASSQEDVHPSSSAAAVATSTPHLSPSDGICLHHFLRHLVRLRLGVREGEGDTEGGAETEETHAACTAPAAETLQGALEADPALALQSFAAACAELEAQLCGLLSAAHADAGGAPGGERGGGHVEAAATGAARLVLGLLPRVPEWAGAERGPPHLAWRAAAMAAVATAVRAARLLALTCPGLARDMQRLWLRMAGMPDTFAGE